MWQIQWSSLAVDDLERFGRNASGRIAEHIVRLVRQGQGEVRHLRGAGDEWRLRVGDYRARFTINRETRTLLVLRVLLAPASS